MKLNLYDQDLNRIAIIGGRFVSCLWSEGYNSIQPFTMELQETEEYKKKVRPDCYVGRDDRKTLMVIKTVQVKDGRIIASGKQAGRCLDDVAFLGTIEAGTEIPQSIRQAWEESEKFRGFEFAESDITVAYGHQISDKSFLQLCETMCQAADLGFRTVRSGNHIRVEFYQPEANPNLKFSELFGNLRVQGVTLSTERLKNHAIVLGEGEGDARARVDVDLSDGGQKLSMIVDARDVSREENETEEDYLARLAARGYEKLLEQQETWECAFFPQGADFGTRYDLGDVIQVLLPEYGLKLESRLTRITQKSQKNKTSTTAEVGSITIVR